MVNPLELSWLKMAPPYPRRERLALKVERISETVPAELYKAPPPARLSPPPPATLAAKLLSLMVAVVLCPTYTPPPLLEAVLALKLLRAMLSDPDPEM